jgi:4,5-DOPA dioxygenase extradiol
MTTCPALFISHGSPMIALEPSPARDFLLGLGESLGKPRAILVMSAHFEMREACLTSDARPAMIYDFGGFPRPLYEMRYDAPGSPELAARAGATLTDAGVKAYRVENRGFDHGTWVPLKLMYPAADIPVVQLSVEPLKDGAHHLALGRALAPLRDEGVLIVGSGSLTHNLFAMTRGARAASAPGWVTDFVDWVHARAGAGEAEALADWTRAPYAKENHPTPEHYLPLPFAAGAGGPGAKGRRLHHSIDMGVLAMDVYAFG